MKKICVVVGSRANYSSIKSVMRAVKAHPELQLQVVACASALLDRYGAVVNIMTEDGFPADAKVNVLIEGENPITMAKSTGLGLLELPTVFDNLQPDTVVTVGDRFETMSTAIASVYMNIPLAHTMGGEVSGTIDESVRHAITKLAHIHFPASQDAADRIIRMGENPASVYMVGCPRMDLVAEVVERYQALPHMNYMLEEGVGGHVSVSEPFLLVSQHPVTTEFGAAEQQVHETLTALVELNLPTIMLWPNADAGSEDIARGIRKFREHTRHEHIRFYKNFPVETFIGLMHRCVCMIGNSSAGIREGAFMGTPVVNLGSRQHGRQRGHNVIDVPCEHHAIVDAVRRQIDHGRYPMDTVYGDGKTGLRIADILAHSNVTIQKQIAY